jgi:hypothetical protein
MCKYQELPPFGQGFTDFDLFLPGECILPFLYQCFTSALPKAKAGQR